MPDGDARDHIAGDGGKQVLLLQLRGTEPVTSYMLQHGNAAKEKCFTIVTVRNNIVMFHT